MKLTLIIAAIKSIADFLNKLFDKSAKKKKDKEDAASDTTKKIFWLLAVLFVAGCSRTPPITLTFHPDDYAELKAGQDFTPTKDGIFLSWKIRKVYDAGVITEYEIRKRGFYKDE